ncbi:MAG TPA: hypothetical protein VNM48_00055 [Chloroflexota bacterium]|nr:hypothetical protein [Chloroflexota bacterium]
MPIMIWAAAGAAAMYFLDPEKGSARRGMVREKFNTLLGDNRGVFETMQTRLSTHLDGGGSYDGASATPTAMEMKDPGAHDRGGWLTLDEAAAQFSVGRREIETALREGRISGRRVAGEGIAPENAPADTIVPPGAAAPKLGPKDDWLVQPDQMERLAGDREHAL